MHVLSLQEARIIAPLEGHPVGPVKLFSHSVLDMGSTVQRSALSNKAPLNSREQIICLVTFAIPTNLFSQKGICIACDFIKICCYLNTFKVL